MMEMVAVFAPPSRFCERGTKVRQEYTDSDGTLTTYYYAGGSYEVQSAGSTEITRQYYALAGVSAGMREGSSFSWFLTDHLGSVVGVTDADATLISQTRYTPFGEIRTDVGTINQTDYGYTFQRNVDGMGLMDYKARYYSPLLGRFTQPDTLVPELTNPQAWNRYSYVNNNPLNFSDPSGHMMKVDDGGSCVGVNCLKPKKKLPDPKPVPVPTPIVKTTPSPTPTPMPKHTDGGQRGDDNMLDVSPYVNAVLDFPGDFTLYQSPMFDLLGGIRLYTTFKSSENLKTPLKIGGNSASFDGFSFTKDSFSFEYFSSTLNEMYESSANVEFFTPWRAKVSVDSSIIVDNVKITNTLGFEYVARLDRMALIVVAAATGLAIYQASITGQCGVPQLCPQ